MVGVGDRTNVPSKGNFGEIEEIGVGGFGDCGDFGEFVGEGEKDFAYRVTDFAEVEVEVGDAGVCAEAGGDVSQDGGFAHAAVAVEDNRLGEGVHEPEFFELAHDVVTSNEPIAHYGIADRVGALDRLCDDKVADFSGDFEEEGLPRSDNGNDQTSL